MRLRVQEYFRIRLSSLRWVLSTSHITTVRLILQYYSRNKDTLQVKKHIHVTPTLTFSNLFLFLPGLLGSAFHCLISV